MKDIQQLEANLRHLRGNYSNPRLEGLRRLGEDLGFFLDDPIFRQQHKVPLLQMVISLDRIEELEASLEHHKRIICDDLQKILTANDELLTQETKPCRPPKITL